MDLCKVNCWVPYKMVALTLPGKCAGESRNYFTERTVHQIYFKIFYFADSRKELWVPEIPATGYARIREPEQYFYFLTGDDAYARHTADYWRFFFNIPTRHFDGPHYYWHHNPPSSTPSTTPTPQANIATLAGPTPRNASLLRQHQAQVQLALLEITQ